MCAAVDLLHEIGAVEISDGSRVEVGTDLVYRRWLALHDRPAIEMGLDVGVVRWHHGDDRLAPSGSRIRSEIAHFR